MMGKTFPCLLGKAFFFLLSLTSCRVPKEVFWKNVNDNLMKCFFFCALMPKAPSRGEGGMGRHSAGAAQA